MRVAVTFALMCLCIISLLSFTKCEKKKCNVITEFGCLDGKSCIHKSWKCDGEEDCIDGSDEKNCKKPKCTASQFKCKNGNCVLSRQRCDLIDHCGDNSDEVGCPTLPSLSCDLDRAFQCPGTKKCIDEVKVCDKRSDCPGGKDESPLCGVNECLTSNGGCAQICVDLKIGLKCSCKDGYVLNEDGITCDDVNECNNYGTCDQECRNTIGSFTCHCNKDYELQADGKTCQAKGTRPTLVIANQVDISQVSLDGKENTRLVYGKTLGGSIAVDINRHDGYIYWGDYVKGTIARAPMKNTSNVAVLANGKLTRSEGIAVDWVGDKLYWTNEGEGVIEVSNTDGSHRKTLVDSDIEKPRGIALLPSKRLMFWADWGKNPKIEVVSMDGEDRKIIIGSEHLRWPNAVAVDQVLNRLYWTDSGKGYIGSSNLDGTDLRKIVQSNTRSSFGLAVFESSIYWTQTNGKVYKANKFDGKGKKEIRGAFFRTYTIQVNHLVAKPQATNPCGNNNGGCKHLCLLSSTEENGFSCHCEDGFTLKDDEKHCKKD